MIFHYYDFISLDQRSNTPLHQQLEEKLILLMLDHKLNTGDILPSPLEMSTHLNLDVHIIETTYKSLEIQNMIALNPREVTVTFKRFTHDYYGGMMTILDLLKSNGYQPSVKKFPAVLLDDNALLKKELKFDIPGPFHEMRIDYYADESIFAVTYSYVPKSIVEDFDEALKKGDVINDYFKKGSSYLRPYSSIQAINYPKYVSEVLGVPYGRAGLLINNRFYNDQDQFIHAQQLYVNHFYEIFINHDVNRIYQHIKK